MRVFDAHCDTLEKLWRYPDLTFVSEDDRLQGSLPKLTKGNVWIQVFATYVPLHIPYGRRFHTALEMIDIFHQKVARSYLHPILSKADLNESVYKDRKGAILFVEGAHPLEASITTLRIFYQLGVRGMGLTWNFQNEVASGCHEPSPGGLTLFGKNVVAEMNQLGMLVDLAHIAEPGFWDVIDFSTAPVIVSHANVKALYNHPRNLTDDQIKALIKKGGVLGLTFYPPFYTNENRAVTIDDLLRHVEHVCSLGGADHVGFGSDFDGIEIRFADLNSPQKYTLLINELQKRYAEAEVKKFLSENWLRVFRTVLK